MHNFIEKQNHLRHQGWTVVQLPNPNPVYRVHSLLTQELRKVVGNNTLTLEQYHRIAQDDEHHTSLQFQLTQFFRQNRLGFQVIQAQLQFFQALLGPDLNVQANPYLRITRPNKPQDNIGYHRDTFYGGSPFELSVLIPYLDVPAESSISVLSGSHLQSEAKFPTTQKISADVTKGSTKHQLGFLYAPKSLDSVYHNQMQPIPLQLGEALIFNLATVHGSVENRGLISRWSSDIRVMNALAPVDLSARPTYYEKLSRSVVTEIADIYHEANAKQTLLV